MSTADELRAKAAKLLDLAREYETPISRDDLDAARTDSRLDHLLTPKENNR